MRAVVVLFVVFAVRSSVDQRAEPIGNHLLFVLARIPREADDRKEVMIMIESRRWQKAVQQRRVGTLVLFRRVLDSSIKYINESPEPQEERSLLDRDDHQHGASRFMAR